MELKSFKQLHEISMKLVGKWVEQQSEPQNVEP